MAKVNFQEDVIRRSHSMPVVVDFWAAWCGPCRVLGPVIEALADEANGTWELVKLDTEAHPEVASQYGIMSIPAVKMFFQGKVIAEFVGALPRHSILSWLEEHLPDQRKSELAALIEQLQSPMVDRAAALQHLAAFVSQYPDLVEGRLAWAWEQAIDAPEEALAAVEDIREGHKHFEAAEHIRTLAELMNCEPDISAPISEKLKAAQIALESRDQEAAIQKLIDAVMIDKTFCNEMPRRALIALFFYLGKDHSFTKKYRRLFDMALY